jgi:hypothetical protein
MYSGTMIDDLICSVARAERAAREKTELCAHELPPTLEELNALCAHFLTDSELMAGVA